tara:strand:+ start:1296 stop:1817 length:522 start_codon:yes stop_codon:yes gene_type:complete
VAYGLLTTEMLSALRPLVAGKVVVDLGAGNCNKAAILKGIGAATVIAVDKNPMPPTAGIKTVQGYFVEVADALPELIDVAFVSWPQNYPNRGLEAILHRAEVVIYLGSNTDGNSCGDPSLYGHLLSRKLLAHVGHQRNTLIAVGELLGEPRKPTFEEVAALSSKLLRYAEKPF